MKFALLYTAISVALLVAGFYRGERAYFWGAGILGLVGLYWVLKAWRKKN